MSHEITTGAEGLRAEIAWLREDNARLQRELAAVMSDKARMHEGVLAVSSQLAEMRAALERMCDNSEGQPWNRGLLSTARVRAALASTPNGCGARITVRVKGGSVGSPGAAHAAEGDGDE